MKSLPQSQEDISILISTGKKTEALKRQLLQLRPHMQAEWAQPTLFKTLPKMVKVTDGRGKRSEGGESH